MWSAVGSEFSRLIDSELKWKTSSKCKPRALRRARTFTQENSKKSTMKNKKESEDFFDRDMKNKGDIMVSESEKLGVNILGRRFSDKPESFPIKKRFSLLLSQPPSCLSLSSFSDHKLESHTEIFCNNLVSLEQDKRGGSPSSRLNCGQGKSSPTEKRSMDDINTQQVDGSVDFSGISILAAAASIERELLDAAGQSFQEHPSFETQLSPRISESHGVDENQPCCNLGLGNNNSKSPLVPSASVEVLVRNSGDRKFDECDTGNSAGSMDGSSCKIKMPSSSDGRLHWDLNSVMDPWENFLEKKIESDLNDSPTLNKGSSLDGEYVNPVCSHSRSAFVIDKGWQLSTVNHGPSYCLGKLKGLKFHDNFDETNYTDSGKKRCLVTTDAFLVEGVTESVSDTKMVDVLEEEKHEANSVSFNTEVSTDNGLPHPVIDGLAGVVSTANSSDPIMITETFRNESNPLTDGKMITETFPTESTTITTIDSYSEHSKQYPSMFCRVGEHTKLRSPDVEKHQLLSTDVAITVAASQSVPCQLDKDTNGVMVHGVHENSFQAPSIKSNSRSMTSEGCLSDETVCSHEINALAVQSKILLLNPQKNFYDEQLPHRSACAMNHDKTSTSMKLDDNKYCILTDKSLCAEKPASPINVCSKHTSSDSEGMMQGTNGIPPMDDALSSLDVCRTSTDCHLKSSGHVDSHLKCSGEVSFEEEVGFECHSDASPVDADHSTGMEMVEFLGDDDSQYEDGELRESILNIWTEDGAEEVEADHVDYASDGRETDFDIACSAFRSQNDFAFGSMECKQEGMSSSHSDENRLFIVEDESQTEHLRKHFTIQGASNSSFWKGDIELDMVNVSKENASMGDSIELHTRCRKRLPSPDGAVDVGEVPGKSSQQAYHRLRSSGWDKMPRVDSAVNSLRNYDRGSFAQSSSIESARVNSVSSVRRNASSGVQISKFSEASCRNDVSHARASRKHDRIDLYTERNSDTSRSIGRNCLPFHAQGKSRGDHWVGSPDHHGNSLYDTPGCRSSASFVQSCSRNAAAAAVAKVESNGFVVASDGTIVKPGGMGSSTHLSSLSSKSSTHSHSIRRGSPIERNDAFDMSLLGNSRELSPDRPINSGWGSGGRYGSGTAILAQSYRYHGHSADVRIDSESLQHPFSTREQSFSPHRRPPIPLSREHIRSPSRSRTRSPHTWAAPIGRNDGRVIGVLNVRRQSRSPNFKSQRRLLRQSSHQCRAMSDVLAPYTPLSRNNSLQIFDSRWIDDYNLEDHHQRRRPSGKSSPNRLLPQSTRLDRIDSRGRMKLDNYCQPLHSGRFQVYAGCGRGSKYEGSDDGGRGKSNRYDMLPPEGHLENNGNTNRLHYDDDSFRAQQSEPTPLRFQRRENDRVFDSRRFRKEMHHFRHGRHG